MGRGWGEARFPSAGPIGLPPKHICSRNRFRVPLSLPVVIQIQFSAPNSPFRVDVTSPVDVSNVQVFGPVRTGPGVGGTRSGAHALWTRAAPDPVRQAGGPDSAEMLSFL